MDEETTKKQQKAPFKNLPGFYQDILGSLMIVFSSSHESMRFFAARDLAGYVDALLRYTRAYDLYPDHNQDKSFGQMATEAREGIDQAITLYREGGSPGSALLELGKATDNLKEIIILREMISEGYELRHANPLNSSSLEAQSTNYRRVE